MQMVMVWLCSISKYSNLVCFSPFHRIPKAFGVSIPQKATFFMTYIMIDGWTSIAAEVMRLFPLLGYHINSILFVRTDKERVKVIPATPAAYFIVLPRLSLYILLGLVYAVISPLILPFLCVYFAFGFLIYRNQVIIKTRTSIFYHSCNVQQVSVFVLYQFHLRLLWVYVVGSNYLFQRS